MSSRTVQPLSPETICTWRLQRDLTQQEAADLFGVSRQAWQHWEIGDREIPGPAETVMWLMDRYPHIKGALTQLARIRYAGEEIIIVGTAERPKHIPKRTRNRTSHRRFAMVG